MKFHEFGVENENVIILLHGMCQKWSTVYEQLKPLEEEYHLIVPAMTGYSENDTNYISFANECRQMEEYICKNYAGKVHGVYGISQGATILSELLARNNIEVKYAVLDGVYVAHQGKLCGIIGAKAIRTIKKNGGFPLKKYGWALKLMGMSKEDIETELKRMYLDFPDEHLDHYFIENYTYRANPDLVHSQTKVYLYCGSSEPYAIKSHRILKKYLQNYTEEIFPDMGHSNLLMKNNNVLIDKLKVIWDDENHKNTF